MHGDSFKIEFLGRVVHPMDVPKIARWIAVFVEGVHERTASEVQPYGREVQKNGDGGFEARSDLVLFLCLNGTV